MSGSKVYKSPVFRVTEVSVSRRRILECDDEAVRVSACHVLKAAVCSKVDAENAFQCVKNEQSGNDRVGRS